jgi:hypothetical protein
MLRRCGFYRGDVCKYRYRRRGGVFEAASPLSSSARIER